MGRGHGFGMGDSRIKRAVTFADERGLFTIDLDTDRCYEWVKSRNRWIQTKRVSTETKNLVLAQHKARAESGLSDHIILSLQ